MSERVGKKRSTVTNYLRLLRLPAIIQKGIVEKRISMGHARALLGVDDPDSQIMIYGQILKYDFSVRKVEEFVRNLNEEKSEEKNNEEKMKFPTEYGDLKNHLAKYFKTNIDFSMNQKGKGKIIIPFKSTGELERILGILDKLEA